MSQYDVLHTVSEATVRRYSERYQEMGYNVRTLGWGSKEQQIYRFAQTLRLADFQGKSVLDIGCGFGDYYDFLRRYEIGFSGYIGVDINPDLVAEAQRQHQGEEDARFAIENLLERESTEPIAQVGVMLGLLNFNLGKKMDNMQYTKLAISQAFAAVSEILVVDFLSSYRNPEYPEENFVYYHRPEEVLSFALELTSDVKLLHDYAPIPQKEFMLALGKTYHDSV